MFFFADGFWLAAIINFWPCHIKQITDSYRLGSKLEGLLLEKKPRETLLTRLNQKTSSSKEAMKDKNTLFYYFLLNENNKLYNKKVTDSRAFQKEVFR